MTIDTKNEMLETLRENNKRASVNKIKSRTYMIMVGDTTAKIGKTGITCLEILFSADKEEMTEQEVFDLINEHAEKFNGSRQDPWKIFQYYRKALIDAGFLLITKTG